MQLSALDRGLLLMTVRAGNLQLSLLLLYLLRNLTTEMKCRHKLNEPPISCSQTVCSATRQNNFLSPLTNQERQTLPACKAMQTWTPSNKSQDANPTSTATTARKSIYGLPISSQTAQLSQIN
jgi:hypothetical protein